MCCYRLVQGRKESHEVCYPANLMTTNLSLDQLQNGVILHGPSALWGFRWFHKISLFPLPRTAMTLGRTITERTGHNRPSSLWARAM